MNISFDILNENPELEKNMPFEDHVFYTTYLKMVEEQLSPLKEEIEREENGGANNYTEIHILHENRGPMSFHYSNELRSRMMKMFTPKFFDDLHLLTERNIRSGSN